MTSQTQDHLFLVIVFSLYLFLFFSFFFMLFRENHFIESLLHFLVRESQYLAEFIAVLDGEIARLIEEQGNSTACYIRLFQYISQDTAMVEIA